MRIFFKVLFVVLLPLLFYSCKKWTDPAPVDDPRIKDRTYCNDPEAVNYNWNFPGVADSTTCIYPADLYVGTYSFTDSVYDANHLLDTLRSGTNYVLQFKKLSKKQFSVEGFCTNGNTLAWTAQRTSFRAEADSLIYLNDTTVAYGQFFCRTLDTLTGTITKNRNDSSLLLLELKVVSDTGIYYHKGWAIKQ